MKRDVIGFYMGIIKNIFILVDEKKTTKAILLNYSTLAMEIVALMFSAFVLIRKIVIHIRGLKFSEILNEFMICLRVSYYRIKLMSFILLMSPFLYVIPAKIISIQTDLVTEFLTMGKSVDELAKRLGSDVSMAEFESYTNDVLNKK